MSEKRAKAERRDAMKDEQSDKPKMTAKNDDQESAMDGPNIEDFGETSNKSQDEGKVYDL